MSKYNYRDLDNSDDNSKNVRPGCKDIWNSFMVTDATFCKHDIPFCPTTANSIPCHQVTWEEAKALHKKHISHKEYDYYEDSFVNWYMDDYKFDGVHGIWHNYKFVRKVLAHFAGAITPDFSTNQDFPEPLKIYATYRMRAYGYWLGKNGIPVINNIRWGTPETFEYCFEGIPEQSIVSVGTVGGSPRKIIDRERFEIGIYKMVERVKPNTILVYGSSNGKCFDELMTKGIRIVSYPSKTSLAFERGNDNMSKGSSGLFHGTVGEHATEEQLFQKANNAIKHLVEKTPNGNKKSMVVGAYDIKTGRVVAAFAGACPKRIADELKERAKLVGGIGTHGVTKRNIVGVCAEFHAVNSLLLAGSRWQDIRLTPAIRPRIGMEIPYCDNCRIMFYDIIDKKRS